MNYQKYTEAPAAGQPTARQAKAFAHKAGLTELLLNKKGHWVALKDDTHFWITAVDGSLVAIDWSDSRWLRD